MRARANRDRRARRKRAIRFLVAFTALCCLGFLVACYSANRARVLEIGSDKAIEHSIEALLAATMMLLSGSRGRRT